MANPTGKLGHGTTIGYALAAEGPFTLIGGIQDVTGGAISVARMPYSSMDMADKIKRAVFGSADLSDLTFDIIYQASERAALEDQVNVEQYFKVTYPDGGYDTFAGCVTGLGHNAPFDEKMMCPVTIGFNGPKTYTPPAGTKVRVAPYLVTMAAGVASIDLTACGPTASVDLSGKKVTLVRLQAKAANGDPITVATGAADGYQVGGQDLSEVLEPGDSAEKNTSTDNATAVGAAAKIFDVTGTGTDAVYVEIEAE